MKKKKFGFSIQWLLIFLPITLLLEFVPGWHHPTALFICSALAIIPLAGVMGEATEHLACRFGQGIGGLLNATFGNAAELIIALAALSKGLTSVVKASLIGSIIGNLLLVLGVSIIAGGTKHRSQKFNKTAASSSTTSLIIASAGLLIASVFHYSASRSPGSWTPGLEQKISLGIAVVLILTYIAGLGFSLKTHKHLFTGEETDEAPHGVGEGWPMKKSIIVLSLATIAVAFLSEILVGTVEAARAQFGLSEVFVGVIVVAIVGNAAEHSTAVLMAMKNKMDLSIGIAVGSSLQIALFVAPVLVFTSFAMGRPMDLEFSIPEVVAVIISVYIVAQIIGDGECNWLEGLQLLSVYVILAILFYFLPDNAPHTASAAAAAGASHP